MISNVDIDDMSPGVPEGQTCVNGNGWIVEWLTPKGWMSVSLVFPDKEIALHCLLVLQQVWPGCELRVYESLKEGNYVSQR